MIGWNFWLPMAEDLYNLPNPATESRRFELRNADFYAYYKAGLRFEDGQNPYYYSDPADGVFSEFLYPPTFLPFYGLISRLAYDQARLVWVIFYGASYSLCFILLLWTARPARRLLFAVCSLVITMISYPLLEHIRLGQIDVLVIGMVLIGFAVYSRGFKTGAAFLFALATAAKVSPLFFLIYFVVFLRDYRFLLAFCLWGVSLIAASLLIVPFDLYADYIVSILPAVSKGTAFWANQSILKFVPAGRGGLAQILSAAGLGGFTLFCLWLSIRRPISQRAPVKTLGEFPSLSESVFMLNMLIILAFAGKAWTMAYVWMILPSALLLAGMLDSRTKPRYLAAIVLAIGLLGAKNYGYVILNSLNLWGNLALTSMLMIGILKPDWALDQTLPGG